MKALLCFFISLLAMSGAAAGQEANQNGLSQGDIPKTIRGGFEDMGIPQEKYEVVYRGLKKSCDDIHDWPHEPHNAYAVKAGDCYFVVGKVIQQISKTQALLVELNIIGEDTDNYFIGNFAEFSEVVIGGKFKRLGYSPSEGDMIIAIGGGDSPVQYETTDGSSKTVPAYVVIFYSDKGQN